MDEMATGALFHFSALSVLPFWFAMIVFPRRELTRRLVRTPFIILPAVICYLVLGFPHGAEALAALRAPSPESLAILMGNPWAASAFWAYAGAFDLFVGRWIFLDSSERRISHLVVAPILTISILFGPLGFGLYALAVLIAGRHSRRASREPGSP